MGVHGYGHDQMLILLKEEGIQYNPDIIMLGFLPMDMSRNLLTFRDFAKPKFVLENNKLRLTGNPVPRPEEIISWDWVYPRIVSIASIVNYKMKELSGEFREESEKITTAILTELTKVAVSIGATPIFTYLPSQEEITPVSLSTTDLTLGEKFFFAMCQKIDQLKCFSTRPFFIEKMNKGITFKSHGHWGPAGHLTVAEAIKGYLSGEGYLTIRDYGRKPIL